jgi:hypothetical protein
MVRLRRWWVLLLAGLFIPALLPFRWDCSGDPPPQAAAPRSPLSTAARLLEQGDDQGACEQLALYLQTNPAHFEVRIHRADMLLRIGRQHEARAELERASNDADEWLDPTSEHRIRCHSLLMQIAQAEDDVYGSHFHRGVGLYLLARERAKLPESVSELPAIGLLHKAAGQLVVAASEHPQDACACYYLCQVWTLLGRTGPAQRWLNYAIQAAPFSQLSPAELRGLHLAAANQAEKTAKTQQNMGHQP